MLLLLACAATTELGAKDRPDRPGDTGASVTDSASDNDDSDTGAPARDRDGDGTPDAEDCEPDDADAHPGATEACNGIDDDCDGETDERVKVTRYIDGDGDGYGDGSAEVCDGAAGYAADSGDCDDTDATRHPDQTDACNAVDDDCDHLIDEDGADTTYQDTDLDGYGEDAIVSTGCAGAGWSLTGGDCDDDEDTIHPGATESCNAIDDDCDGSADAAGVCPCDVQYWPDTAHPYLFCTTTGDWSTADAACAALGSYELVTFDSTDEGLWVESVVFGYTDNYWWIGYTDQPSEGTWIWTDGTTSGYTNWSSGEPNNSHGRECYDSSEEDCAMIKWSGAAWNDYPCECTMPYYICEGVSEARPEEN